MKNIPWGAVRSILTENFSFGDIKKIVGYANINMAALAHLEQKPKDGASKSQLLSAIDQQVGSMPLNDQSQVASICCEEMLLKKPNLIDEFERVLSRVGWKFSGEKLLPIEIFDNSELKDIPECSHQDILKAASRLRDGDLSGALSSACAALDSATGEIYLRYQLGDPNKASFQERLKKSIDAVSAKEKLEQELREIGWQEPDFKPLLSNLEGSLNQASFVMQKLRSNMGDVHGTKPVLTALVYDSIKWSLLLLRVLVTSRGF